MGRIYLVCYTVPGVLTGKTLTYIEKKSYTESEIFEKFRERANKAAGREATITNIIDFTKIKKDLEE